MKMILEQYLQREILEKLIWIIVLLTLILTSHRFVDYLEDAAAGRLPGELLLSVLTTKMLAVIPRLLPVAVFLSVILALTRLSGDREIVIMRVAGLGIGFKIRSVCKISLIYAAVVAIMAFGVSPWAENEVQQLRLRAQRESDISGITPGRFKEFSDGDRVVYVDEMTADAQTMQGVFLQVRDSGRVSLLTSNAASFKVEQQSGSRYIVFANGRRYLLPREGGGYQITSYRRYGQLIDAGNVGAASRRLEGAPTLELLRGAGPEHSAELQWRLAYVIASLLLPLLGIIITRFSFGANRYLALLIAVSIYFIYSNLLSISRTLTIQEALPPWLGLSGVHLGLAVLMLVLYRQQQKAFRGAARADAAMTGAAQ
ncbi:MAG: LPS export ABC transporter permease LptF [Gammaproteobacteria bacterium]|jgi:lipopolysaccharide export system permease protein|nr:MAG: LPS export ABC transporter permease LptF [Gammaproteobacteria bacterium]